MDSFTPGRRIPSCQLAAIWTKDGEIPKYLLHKVELCGAKEPFTFIKIELRPSHMEQGTDLGGSLCVNLANVTTSEAIFHTSICLAPPVQTSSAGIKGKHEDTEMNGMIIESAILSVTEYTSSPTATGSNHST